MAAPLQKGQALQVENVRPTQLPARLVKVENILPKEINCPPQSKKLINGNSKQSQQ